MVISGVQARTRANPFERSSGTVLYPRRHPTGGARRIVVKEVSRLRQPSRSAAQGAPLVRRVRHRPAQPRIPDRPTVYTRNGRRVGSVILGHLGVRRVAPELIYSETAAMFPDKPRRDLALRARGLAEPVQPVRPDRRVRVLDRVVRRTRPVREPDRLARRGRVVSRGRATRSTQHPGRRLTVRFAQVIGIGVVFAVWLFNVFGVNPCWRSGT